jgi:hypothetical protein
MMRSAIVRPTALSRDQPKTPAARSFQSATTPSDFMTTTASRAVSNTKRRASCGAAGPGRMRTVFGAMRPLCAAVLRLCALAECRPRGNSNASAMPPSRKTSGGGRRFSEETLHRSAADWRTPRSAGTLSKTVQSDADRSFFTSALEGSALAPSTYLKSTMVPWPFFKAILPTKAPSVD